MSEHWTSVNSKAMRMAILWDFIAEIETELERRNLSHAQYAAMVGVSESRVSQVLTNEVENMTIASLLKFATPLGFKVALVPYKDGDPENNRGPVLAGIIAEAWRQKGMPRDYDSMGYEGGFDGTLIPLEELNAAIRVQQKTPMKKQLKKLKTANPKTAVWRKK